MNHYFKYAKYLIKHCWYVRKMCWKNGLYWQGLVHDLSKWRPSEFIPYARFFYGDYPEELNMYEKIYHWTLKTKKDIQHDFDVAWLKHIHRNPHHWQYWILLEDSGGEIAMEMPEKYVKEMLCDWWGASVATGNGGNSKDWYEKVKKDTKMADSTQKYFEKAVQNSTTPYLLPSNK